MDANKWLQGDDRRFAKGALCLFLMVTAGAVAALIGTDLAPGALFGAAGFGFVGALATIFALDLERTDFATTRDADLAHVDVKGADAHSRFWRWVHRQDAQRRADYANPCSPINASNPNFPGSPAWTRARSPFAKS